MKYWCWLVVILESKYECYQSVLAEIIEHAPKQPTA